MNDQSTNDSEKNTNQVPVAKFWENGEPQNLSDGDIDAIVFSVKL